MSEPFYSPRSSSDMWKRRLESAALPALITLISVLGAGLILAREATYGVGLWGDYASYISTARSLLAGDGFTQIYGWEYGHWPPLYPMLLAGASLWVFDPLDVAGPLNAVVFGLTIFAVGQFLRQRIQHRFLVVWVCLAIMLAVPLTRVAQMAMAEAPFILFATLALIQASNALDSDKWSDLILAAALASLAFLTRYPGITVIGTVLFLLLFQRGGLLSERLKRVALYTAITTLPMCLWLLRNYLDFGSLYDFDNRNPSTYTLAEILSNYFNTIASWVYLNLRLKDVEPVLVILVGAVFVALTLAVGYTFVRVHRKNGATDERRRLALFYLFGGFALVYLMFFIVLQSQTDLQPLGNRYLSPLYIPLLLFVTFALDSFLSWEQKRNLIGSLLAMRTVVRGGGCKRPSLLVVSVAFVLFLWLGCGAVVNAREVRLANEGVGLGLRGPKWEYSAVLEYVRGNFPPDALVLSNDGRPLYIYANRLKLKHLDTADFYKSKRAIERGIEGKDDAYVVWFHLRTHNVEYSVWELPWLERLVDLEDSIVFKVNEGYDTTTSLWSEYRAIVMGEPVIRSRFDVYMLEGVLSFVKDPCRADDTRAALFLHIVPLDANDLPEHRRQYDFDNLDFRFSDFGVEFDGKCMATVALPEYDIAEIRTGQRIAVGDGLNYTWEGEYALPE